MLVAGLLGVDLVASDAGLGRAAGSAAGGDVQMAGLRQGLGTDTAGGQVSDLGLCIQSQSSNGRDDTSVGSGRERRRSGSRLNVRVGLVGGVKHLVKGILAINAVQAGGLQRSASGGHREREGRAGAGVAEKDVSGNAGQGHAVLLVGSIGLASIGEARDDGSDATSTGSLAGS